MKASYFRNNPYGRFYRNLAGSLLLALIISLVYFRDNSDNPHEFLITFSWAFVICFTQWLGHSYIFSLLDKKISWQEHPGKRAIYSSISIIVYSVFAFIVVTVIMTRIVFNTLPENPVQWALKSSVTAILVSFAVSIVFLAIGFFRSWKHSLLEAERFKAEMLMYKYESLQNQINPHFLFNSFNVLSNLVYEDRKKAVKFITQMSQLFRYVLDSRDKELVPVTEELEFISSFAFLLQTRFEDKLSITIDVQADQDDLIVPMTMQLLIENCVKHNEISAAKPLTISISRSNDSISVVNNLQLKPVASGSTETGLSNIRQQYSYFTDKEIVISRTADHFSVAVPVLKANNQ